MPKFIYVKFKTMFEHVTKTTLHPDLDEQYQVKTLIKTIEDAFGDKVKGFVITETEITKEHADAIIENNIKLDAQNK